MGGAIEANQITPSIYMEYAKLIISANDGCSFAAFKNQLQERQFKNSSRGFCMSRLDN